jgi:hypothetical protein
MDRPNTRLWRDLRARWRAPLELSSFGRSKLDRPTKPAAVLVTVKGKSLRDGLRPPLTVTARGGQSKSGRDEEMAATWAEQGDGSDRRSCLTMIAPYKVFGCRPLANGATHSGGRRRKTSEGGDRGKGYVECCSALYGRLDGGCTLCNACVMRFATSLQQHSANRSLLISKVSTPSNRSCFELLVKAIAASLAVRFVVGIIAAADVALLGLRLRFPQINCCLRS